MRGEQWRSHAIPTRNAMTDWPKNLSLSFGDAEFLEAALAEYLVKKGPGDHSVGVYGRLQGLINGPGDGPSVVAICKCGHRQSEKNWCEKCGHRTTWLENDRPTTSEPKPADGASGGEG